VVIGYVQQVSAYVRELVCAMARAEFALSAITQIEDGVQQLVQNTETSAITDSIQSIHNEFCLGFQHFQVLNVRPKFIANQRIVSLINQVRMQDRYIVKWEFNVGCATYVRSLLQQYSHGPH